MTTGRRLSLSVSLAALLAGTVGCGGSTSTKDVSSDGGASTPGNRADGAAFPASDAAASLSDARPNGGGFIDASFPSDGRRPDGGGVAADTGTSVRDASTPSFDAGGFSDAGIQPTLDGGFPTPADSSAGMGGTGGSGTGGSAGSGAGGAGGSGGSGGGGGMGGSGGSRPDAGPPDSGSPPDAEVPVACRVELRPVGATALTAMLAGGGAVSMVKAEAVGPVVTGPLAWSWTVTFGGQPVSVTPGARDQSVIRFSTERPGEYVLRASTSIDGRPCASGAVPALAINPLSQPQANWFRAVVLPPPGANDLAVFTQTLALFAAGEVTTNVPMGGGTPVAINPVDRQGVRTIPSYVRIVSPNWPLSFDGYAGATGFNARLNGDALYDILVVPSGPDGSGVGAQYAPVLYEDLELGQLTEPDRFRLDRGIAVRGRVTVASGAGQPGARVLLRNPKLASTVGATDASGFYEVLVKPGTFSFVVAPPPGQGLPEAVVGTPGVTVAGAANAPRVDLAWRSLPTARLSLALRGLNGQPVAGARVRVQAHLEAVALATVSDLDGPRPGGYVPGIMREERDSEPDGSAVFSALPEGIYTVTVLPDSSSPEAITTTTIGVQAGGPPRTITLVAKLPLNGKLTGNGPLAGIEVIATDTGSDLLAEPIKAVSGADGSFTLQVAPRRRYLLVAHPPAISAFARTFVGAGPVEASDFTVTQRMHARRSWVGRVYGNESGRGIAGAVIKAYCYAEVVECADHRKPLAEAVSDADGNFLTILPDIVQR